MWEGKDHKTGRDGQEEAVGDHGGAGPGDGKAVHDLSGVMEHCWVKE